MSDQVAIEPTRRLLKEGEVAQILSLEVATLRRWRWSGRGPRFLKLGGAVRYDPADLSAFIEQQRRTSTSDSGSEVIDLRQLKKSHQHSCGAMKK